MAAFIHIRSVVALACGAYLFASTTALAGRTDPEPIPSHFTSHLPLIHVVTEGKAKIDWDDLPAEVTILEGSANSSRELLTRSRTPTFAAEVSLRGYSSSKFRKRQYNLELRDLSDRSKDIKEPLLGLPKHEKWVLSSQFIDRSLIRNPLAFSIAAALPQGEGAPYAPRTKPIELFINGTYHGVYYLTEKIEISKNRLNIPKPDLENPAESTFMLKVERKDLEPDEFVYAWDKESMVAFGEPSSNKLRALREKDPAQAKRVTDEIVGKFREFERVLHAIGRGDRSSYRSLLDMESFQNFILLQELFRNIDGFRRSMNLFYDSGKFHIGPVWDFDLAAGNLLVLGQKSPEGFQSGHSRYIDSNHEVFWFRTLLADPAFAREVVARYWKLRQPGQAFSDAFIFGQIKKLAAEVGPSAAARNFTAWTFNPSLKDGPVALLVPKYASGFQHRWAVTDLHNFLKLRLRWLDRNIGYIGMRDRERVKD